MTACFVFGLALLALPLLVMLVSGDDFDPGTHQPGR
jgi:hypothetical protein